MLSLAGGAAGVGFAVFATPLAGPAGADDAAGAGRDGAGPAGHAVCRGGDDADRCRVRRAARVAHVQRSAQRDSLREGARGAVGGRERLRSTLLVAQIAASVAAAGLGQRCWSARSFACRRPIPGSVAGGVLTLRTRCRRRTIRQVADRERFYERVVGDVQALPGVTAAAYTSFTPMIMRGGIWAVEMPGIDRQQNAAEVHTASLRFLTPGYFATLGVPIASGTRHLRLRHVRGAVRRRRQRVVCETLLAEGGCDRAAIHHRLLTNGRSSGSPETSASAGSRRSASRRSTCRTGRSRTVGCPSSRRRICWSDVDGDPLALAPRVRRIVLEVDPGLPVSDVQTMEDVVSQQTWRRGGRRRP